MRDQQKSSSVRSTSEFVSIFRRKRIMRWKTQRRTMGKTSNQNKRRPKQRSCRNATNSPLAESRLWQCTSMAKAMMVRPKK